jgi:hypothetical protein
LKTTFRKNFKTNIFFSKKLFFISPNVIAVIFWNILTIFEDWMERGCFGNWYSRQETNKRTFDVLVISRFCVFAFLAYSILCHLCKKVQSKIFQIAFLEYYFS